MTKRTGTPRGAREGGYSLVEVVVALGIITAVLVAIASMFILAQANVKSGRELTEATSVAQHIMEDINKLSYNGLEIFHPSTWTTLNSYTADTRVSGYAQTHYKALIDEKLWKAYALVTFTPIGGNIKPATFASGEAIRIKVTVHWKEINRNRSVTMEGVRF